ncbi:MAG: sulfotransferase [Gaiellaceae bacterium]
MAAPSEASLRPRLYPGAVARVLIRARRSTGADLEAVAERPVLVLGAPRSGTSFVARCIGRVPGFADLGELRPWKEAIPRLASLPQEEAAEHLRGMLESIRRYGFVRHLRAVEQSPETAFVLAAAVHAYPQAAVVHMVRDPRDVASSLLQKGWLRAERRGRDDVGAPYGGHARFWVEPDRAAEFDQASEARRAGWAWRSYVSAARAAPANTVEVQYEELASDPEAASERLAAHIGADPILLGHAFSRMHCESVGRWRRNLTPEQVAEVESEAGALMQELGYD